MPDFSAAPLDTLKEFLNRFGWNEVELSQAQESRENLKLTLCRFRHADNVLETFDRVQYVKDEQSYKGLILGKKNEAIWVLLDSGRLENLTRSVGEINLLFEDDYCPPPNLVFPMLEKALSNNDILSNNHITLLNALDACASMVNRRPSFTFSKQQIQFLNDCVRQYLAEIAAEIAVPLANVSSSFIDIELFLLDHYRRSDDASAKEHFQAKFKSLSVCPLNSTQHTLLNKIHRSYELPPVLLLKAEYERLEKNPGNISSELELDDAKKSLAQLIAIFSKLERSSIFEIKKRLKQFLAARWERIRDNSLSYTFNRPSVLNEFCKKIAAFLDKDHANLLLMPTLASEDDLYGNNINHLKWGHFVVTPNGKSFIALKEFYENSYLWADKAEENTYRYYDASKECRFKTFAEMPPLIQKNIRTILPESETFEMQAQKTKQDNKQTALGLLQALRLRLAENDINGGRGGRELYAGEALYLSIHQFFEDFNALDETTQNRLRNLTAGPRSGYFGTFGDIINLMDGTRPRPTQLPAGETFSNLGAAFCSQSMGGKLDSIIEHNNDVLKTISLKQCISVVPRNQNLKATSDKIQRVLKGSANELYDALVNFTLQELTRLAAYEGIDRYRDKRNAYNELYFAITDEVFKNKFLQLNLDQKDQVNKEIGKILYVITKERTRWKFSPFAAESANIFVNFLRANNELLKQNKMNTADFETRTGFAHFISSNAIVNKFTELVSSVENLNAVNHAPIPVYGR